MKNRILNKEQFELAIDQYLIEGIINPVEIAKLLNERGCICATVAVELYLNSLIKQSQFTQE